VYHNSIRCVIMLRLNAANKSEQQSFPRPYQDVVLSQTPQA
jgi:hypothetical protein